MAKRKKATDSETSPDFETALEEVEQIVRRLEAGDLSLDESLRHYETAVGRMRHCYQLLEDAERKISVLSGFDAEGNPVLDPSDPADSSAPDNNPASPTEG